MTAQEKFHLHAIATKARMLAIEGVYSAQAGHPGGSLSAADIITYLYQKQMCVDPKNPHYHDRDRFVLSKGHAAPILYATLAIKGFFPESEMKTLRQPGSILQGHPDMKLTPGVDMTTGSLGQGVAAANGMAIAGKLSGKSYRVYAMVGDGEIQEGEVWEAFMFANHYKLNNLCVIVDNNNLQIDGPVDKVMSPYPINEKLKAFGFNLIEIDGHDFDQIENAFRAAEAYTDGPTAILARTTKGKCVSYMENQVKWHGSAPKDQDYKTAVEELTAQLKDWEGKCNG